MTKTEKNIFERYLMADKHDLIECYQTYSNRKALAQNDIMKEMFNMPNGRGFKIISYNTSMFTCGYMYSDEHEHLVYHTPTKRLDIVVQ